MGVLNFHPPKSKGQTRHVGLEEEEEEEEFIRIHGYYHDRGTQGARCYTDGASLQPDESEGCSPVSAVGLIRLRLHSFGPLDDLLLVPTLMLSDHGNVARLLKVEVAASIQEVTVVRKAGDVASAHR